jgi:preprotein translocase subunit SecA
MANPLTAIHRVLLKIFGTSNDRVVRRYRDAVERIASFEAPLGLLSDDALRGKTSEFRDRIGRGETLNDILPEAFAVVRESARRSLRTKSGTPMRHFDVQMIGGMVLHEGKIAEMATGEGKTLVATLPAYLNALRGLGVHVVTVNDYLARRDADWMRPLYESLGLTVGAIQSQMSNQDRKVQYQCDITYGTNNEFGFDYLRDHMKVDLRDQVQRGRIFAIVDEVDSILIDEARTPLIISGPAESSTDKYYVSNRVAKRLVRGQDFEVREKERSVILTESGIEKAEKMVGVASFYSGRDMEWPHLLEQALRAQYLYHRDVDYVVREKEVVIVDEFTGRLMEGRTWSEGLHQAVEAKEGLSIRRESQTYATITLQNYFKLYGKIAGMTGTAMTEASEFDKIYKLEVVSIPTNRPVSRVDDPDVVFRTAREKYTAIVEEIVAIHDDGKGRPMLVGTTSIERSELLSGMLRRRGVEHFVLNAKQHEREAEIVAGAGQRGSVVISTNMAGRGTDIVLGPGVVELGGLHVVGTERHEARRIDNQLRGRCARQGDPGSAKFFLSLEDDLMRRFAADRVSAIFKRLGMKEGEEISHPWVTRSIAHAQRKVENYHFEIRKNLLEYDAVMNEQREIVYRQRQQILNGTNLSGMIREMMRALVPLRLRYYFEAPNIAVAADDGESSGASLPSAQAHASPHEEIHRWLKSSYGIDLQPREADEDVRFDDRIEALSEQVLAAFDRAYAERRGHVGDEMMARIERFILLMELDDKWKDHLHAMDHLRASIGLRSYGQKDPKIAYKTEGYEMFHEMIESLRSSVTQLVLRVRVREEDEQALKQNQQLEQAEFRKDDPAAQAGATSEGAARAGSPANPPAGPIQPIVNTEVKVGRNDPCPCGSGKKYKKCCGIGKE